jgi:DNA-binding IscR family transcriptional regulator
VSRERGGTLQYAPEPEVPARFALQLHTLAQGLVLVAGGTELTTADQRRLARVAWDGIPVLRRHVLHVLAQANSPLTTRAIATTVQFPTTTVRRTLEDLQALKLIRCAKGGLGIADGWQLRPQWRTPLGDLLQRLHKVPRPAGTIANAGATDRQQAHPERRGIRVRRAHADARQAGRAATRRSDGEERQPPA